MYYKVHGKGTRKVLAVADSEIIGKTFKEKELEFKVSKAFYKGEKISEKELNSLLKNFDNINLAGKKVIEVALKAKVIKKENIIWINGIPHAQQYYI